MLAPNCWCRESIELIAGSRGLDKTSSLLRVDDKVEFDSVIAVERGGDIDFHIPIQKHA